MACLSRAKPSIGLSTGLAHGRREEAVAIQQISGARLSMAGISQFDCFHDVANAIPPLSFEGLGSTYYHEYSIARQPGSITMVQSSPWTSGA